MQKTVQNILEQDNFSKEDLVLLLSTTGKDKDLLFEKAAETKKKYVGNIVYFRGLVEFSNLCAKNCNYCGIRAGNKDCHRYTLTDEQILEGIKYSYDHKFGSVVLQSGERKNKDFIESVDRVLKKIVKLTSGEVGITLSAGEQSEETYRRWLESGASRYLLRIESTNRKIFNQIHPNNALHDFDKRLEALKTLQKVGFQTGTGIMIGLPEQTLEDLANDILFMQNFDIDMIGMGPYIEHKNTPMYDLRDKLLPIEERFDLSLKMIAILRIVMKDINIASATALQAIHQHGREMGLKVGSNVIMPNVTPTVYHGDYSLYNNKPTVNEVTDEYIAELEKRIHSAGDKIAYGVKGDPKHFASRTQKDKV